MTRLKLRRLTAKEKKLKDKTLQVRIYNRYRIIAEASQGVAPMQISDRVNCDFSIVYDWMRRFNESGFETFERVTNPYGRPPILTSQQVRELIRVALSRPEDLGMPFTQWSMSKLAEYCRSKGLLPEISSEWVRRLLRREGVTYQRTKTKKDSPDPEFEFKKTASSTSTPRSPKTGTSYASMSAGRWS